jgi:transposase-like protein
LLATDDSQPELATEADVREAVVARVHLFDRPLPCCPTCGSEQLEPVVEKATQDVHFMCRNCSRYWHVELGFVHRVTQSPT